MLQFEGGPQDGHGSIIYTLSGMSAAAANNMNISAFPLDSIRALLSKEKGL